MKRTIHVLVSVLLIAFLALSPPWLLRGLMRDEYRAFMTKPPAAWHGRIEIWHIAGFRVYQGSVTDYLQERADAYCKKHAGVHIDVVGLTEKQYADRLERGAVPDAYSFPPGYVYPEQLTAFAAETPPLAGNLCAAQAGGTTYAVPYLMSGYFLAANGQLLTKYGFELPETADGAYLQSALDLAGETPQLSMPAVHAARMGLTGELAPAEAFQQGKCMLAVLDARATGDLLRGETKGLLVDAIPFAEYTDEVFYLGPAAGASPEQAAALAGFAMFLLSEKEQQRLTSLGALPVIVPEGKPAYADDLLTALFEAYASPVAPEPFLYERHRAKLFEEALAALGGDPLSVSAFFERLAVVENDKL